MLKANIVAKYAQLQQRIEAILRLLTPGHPTTLSMSAIHKQELKLFLESHFSTTEELFNKHTDTLNETVINRSIDQILSEELFQLDSTLRFIEVGFVRPRTNAEEAQILEAADWLCTDMFIEGMKPHRYSDNDQPVGPIAALDATRSPALWGENTTLDIPSLFKNKTTYKTVLPVICLPSDIARSPEFYPLLSHEVGHSLDTALGISSKVIASFTPTTTGKKYWREWMREIVADYYGVFLSGSAFGISFANYIKRYNLPDDIDRDSKYPPISLRLHIIAETIKSLYTEVTDLDPILNFITQEVDLKLKPEEFEELLDAYIKDILPLLQKTIIPNPPTTDSLQDQEDLTIHTSKSTHEKQIPDLSFIRLPSVLTHSLQSSPEIAQTSHEIFRKWHSWMRENKPPDWANIDSNWQFKEHLTTLRPTFTLAGGKKKRPPVSLLTAHDNIDFLGATNKSLTKFLQKAAQLRTEGEKFKPWSTISIYFASDLLLEQVIYDNSNLAEKKATRNEAIDTLKKLFADNPEWCPSVTMYLFDGPAIFGSYWDADEPGGRIHISPQLLGKDIGICPSQDHVWTTNPPSYEYESYREHLEMTKLTSHSINNII